MNKIPVATYVKALTMQEQQVQWWRARGRARRKGSHEKGQEKNMYHKQCRQAYFPHQLVNKRKKRLFCSRRWNKIVKSKSNMFQAAAKTLT